MRRTFGYFTSLLIILYAGTLNAQDTVQFPLKIRAGIDVLGPGIYLRDKNNLNLEGHISFDWSEKLAFVLEGGYLNYKYSQYNYDYQAKGIFIRTGVDFNLLKPDVSYGKYWAGLGLRYGLSSYNSETASFQYENYWGSVTSSIPMHTGMGHFLEVAPGVRTELFRNFSIGWSIRLKFLISAGGSKDLRPIYFPGYGNGSKTVNAGINYYLIWSIPFKTKTVITRPAPEEPEETEEGPVNQTVQSPFTR